ncbi:MAG: RluA family pseudouridine synthase [Planctomycetota bacterium]
MIRILHEDQHLVVVDKPARTLVVAAPGRPGHTLIDQLSRQLGARTYAVHRLDEDTTGTLLVARTEAARTALEEMFRQHQVQRVYLAVVERVPSPPAGTIESLLVEGSDGVVRAARTGRGRRAVTHYRTVGREQGAVLVECRLETGRRNQIRVHLAELGCPVVGDRKYGWRSRDRRRGQSLLLHAWRLAFAHPCTASDVDVIAPLPPSFPRVTARPSL